MAKTSQYKKAYFKFDDNQINKNEEKSEQNNSYYNNPHEENLTPTYIATSIPLY